MKPNYSDISDDGSAKCHFCDQYDFNRYWLNGRFICSDCIDNFVDAFGDIKALQGKELK